MALGHGRAQVQHVTIGGTPRRHGHALPAARRSRTRGAFADMGTILAPFMTRPMSSGVYAIPNIECRTTSVVTNTTPTVAYRGAGRPEATAAIERAMDLFAAEIGMDPAEVRRINLIAPFSEPHTTVVGQTYDVGDYVGALDRVLEAAGYDELRAEQAAPPRVRRPGAARHRRAASTSRSPAASGNGETAKIEVARRRHGHHLHRHVAARSGPRHGVVDDRQRPDRHPDRRASRSSGATPTSCRSAAARWARGRCSRAARPSTRRRSSWSTRPRSSPPRRSRRPRPTSCSTSTAGAFHVAGTPAVSKSWADLAALARRADGEPLAIDTRFDAAGPTFPFGAHVAVVEVDTETGQVRLVRHVACDDAGTVINPLLLDGQRHGGIAQGAAQALMEEVRYDEDGNPITSNLADYAMISAPPSCRASSWCRWRRRRRSTRSAPRASASPGTIGSTPAVQSAVVDAVSHLGVRHIDMPTTAERVWQAIQAAAG